jgi:hypothetical protein
MGIWLALGLIPLASCAPITLGSSGAKSSSQANVGSAAPPAAQPEQHFNSNAPVDDAQSTALTNYLHSDQLPLVGARVLTSNGGPRQAILYGYVRTPFGRADAVDKTRQWLNDSGAQIDNRIKIEPALAGNEAQNPSSATADNNSELNNPDIQQYQDQQRQELSQQQQYMSQGSQFGGGSSGGLMMVLPFLLGGSIGGGGTSFGFGGGGLGSPYGSPYGSPSYPPPVSGSPYGP